jgi:hypothetical protein
MTKTKFEIGEAEKHLIIVDSSIVWKRVIIELDGVRVANRSHFSPGGKKFEFEVGNSEKHHVEVRAGGFSHPELFVDGKAVSES